MSEVNWRRIWKPDLHSCSWQPLKNLKASNKDGTFLVKAKFSDSSYEFLATDLLEFWYEKLDQECLKKRSAKLNPNIEAPLTKILDQIKASLCKQGNGTDLALTRKNDSIVLTLTSQLAGLPFTWTFRADSTTYDLGRDHLTLPLMAMVGELSRQKQELFKLLAAKDKQIDDYKAQGVKVTRKHFETAPFDEVAFNSCMVTSKGFEEGVKSFEDKIFNHSSQDLYRNICTKQAWLRHGLEDLTNYDSDEEMESEDAREPGAPSVESWTNRIPESIAKRKNNNANSSPSPSKSPSPLKTSPTASPSKASSSPSKSSSTESTPVKDTEMLRRQALERKLEQEEVKKMEKSKKKKKLKL